MKKLLTLPCVCFAAVLLFFSIARAADLDEVTASMVLQTSADTTLRAEASDTAKEVAKLPAGTVVITLEAAQDGWCNVISGENSGYVKISDLETLADTEALNAEFEQTRNNFEVLFNELEEKRSQELQARIWGAVIIVLVAAIFGTGIMSAVRKSNTQKQESGELPENTEEPESAERL